MAFITFKLVFNIEHRNGIELVIIYLFSEKAYFSHRYTGTGILLFVC